MVKLLRHLNLREAMPYFLVKIYIIIGVGTLGTVV